MTDETFRLSQLSDVTRLELIDESGRAYVKYGVTDIQFSKQDLGTTLKVFVRTDPNSDRDGWLENLKKLESETKNVKS